jgi:tetratricopeptide (TPR) repeat protein
MPVGTKRRIGANKRSNGIQPVTQYAKDNWPAKPAEFYAEAFSLWHTDPVFFASYSTKLKTCSTTATTSSDPRPAVERTAVAGRGARLRGTHAGARRHDAQTAGRPAPAHPTARLRPAPPELAMAEAQFARATADYEAGRFTDAARGFLEAARALRLGGPYADGFTGNRRYCYRNAASAFSAAGDIAGGRAALAAAAREDPTCADTLGELQAGLAPP